MSTRFFLCAALALAGCADTAKNSPQALVAPAAVFVDPENPESAEVRALAERVIDLLAATLLSEVTTAVAAGGPENAIDVCHVKALPLSNGMTAGIPRVTGVKRTSLRLRNPANAPDAAEQLALARVAQEAGAGTLSPVLMQRLEHPDGPEWRVYRPVSVAPPCVACHGPVDSLSMGVRTKLAALYPADQATGYAAGDWRGLIRVSVAGAPPPGRSPSR